MLFRLLFISFLLFLTSCDGRGDPNGYQEKLVGKWSIVNLDELNEYYSDYYPEESRVLEFFADGTAMQVATFSSEAPEDGQLEELYFTYKVVYGNRLRYIHPEDPEDFVTFTIVELTDQTFVEKQPLKSDHIFKAKPPTARYERISD